MSLFGALASGVSGLTAQSSAMGAISDNITNINTVGYKNTRVDFQTLVTKQTSSTFYSAGGVQSKPRSDTGVQGLLQASTSSTDISISGQGYFVVNEANVPTIQDQFLYTRAGSFFMDNEGFLRNTSGFYLQGWPTDASGNVVTVSGTGIANQNIVSTDYLETVNLNRVGGTASATTKIAIGANLPANDSAGTAHRTDVQFFDTLGNANSVSIVYTKSTITNEWDLTIEPPAGTASLTLYNTAGGSGTQVYKSAGQLEFTANPGDGSIVSVNGINYEFDNNASVLTARQTRTMTLGGTITANDVIQATVNGTAISYTTTTTSATDAATGLAAAINANATVNNIVSASSNAGVVTLTSRVAAVNPITGAVPLWTTDAGGGNTVASANTAGVVGSGNISVTIGSTVSASVANLLAQIQLGQNFTFPTGAHTAALKAGNTSAIIISGGSGFADMIVDVTNLTTDGAAASTAITKQGLPTTKTFTIHQDNTAAANNAIEFTASGIPAAFNVAEMEIVNFSSGASNMDAGTGNAARISLDFGTIGEANGMTQFGASFTPQFITQNGSRFGTFAGVTVGVDGQMTALFDNGETRKIFKLPIATFTNVNQLEGNSGNVWNATEASGDYTLREADSGPAGQIIQGALEASTVDIGEEFTKLIVVQRAYSAAAKIISTADEMLAELMRIKG